jgi:NADPH:quinone reductase-like Zn-dependent oxidoreductase
LAFQAAFSPVSVLFLSNLFDFNFLQIDPPDSQLLYLKSANISYLFHHAWSLSLGQQGRYQHILKDIMNRLEKGTLKPNIVRTVSIEYAVEELKRLSDIRVGKVVMEI